MICPACDYHHDNHDDLYGCPNCEGSAATREHTMTDTEGLTGRQRYNKAMKQIAHLGERLAVTAEASMDLMDPLELIDDDSADAAECLRDELLKLIGDNLGDSSINFDEIE